MPGDREKRAGGRRPPADPNKFNEAIDAFRRRDPITDDQIDLMDAAERERSFWVSGVAEADIVQDVFDAVDRALRDGTDLAEFKAEIGGSLEDAWGEERGYRIENIFRTNLITSYSAGRYEIMTAPEAMEARPYWRLDITDDERTSDLCLELLEQNIVLPADDPFWDTHIPPLHFCCRDEIVPLTEDEAREEGLLDEAPDLKNEPDDGFGKAPSETGDDWEPDPDAYDKDIGDVLKDKLDL